MVSISPIFFRLCSLGLKRSGITRRRKNWACIQIGAAADPQPWGRAPGAEAGGDYKAAAQELGLHPNSLLRLIRNLGLCDLLKS